MAIDYAALKTEINSDPSALGYAAPRTAGDDVTLAAIMNTARASIQIRRADISAQEIVTAILSSTLGS